jgi:hypothetical protein
MMTESKKRRAVLKRVPVPLCCVGQVFYVNIVRDDDLLDVDLYIYKERMEMASKKACEKRKQEGKGKGAERRWAKVPDGTP